MSALKKYVLGPPRDPNVWLNHISGEVNANRAREAVVDSKVKSYSFVANYSDFVSGLASALKGGGGVFRELEAPLYPYHDAHAYDLNCLGADMYAAFCPTRRRRWPMPDEPSPETLPDTVPDNEETGTTRPNVPQAVLDALPDDIRTSVIQAASFSGPLPPSAMYREYEEVMPGSANRLMELTENQQEHRHKWESDALGASISDNKRGQ